MPDSIQNHTAWAWAVRHHEDCMWAAWSAQFDRRAWAHELRNRLAPTLTLAQMLKRAAALDAETLRWLGESMEKQMLALSGFAEAALQGGGQASADLRQLAEQAAAVVSPTLGGPLSVVGPAGAGPQVVGDAVCLLHPLAWCLLHAASQQSLAVEIREASGQAWLMIGAPPPPGLGLKLAASLIEAQGGGICGVSACGGDLPPAAAPQQGIVIRLALAP